MSPRLVSLIGVVVLLVGVFIPVLSASAADLGTLDSVVVGNKVVHHGDVVTGNFQTATTWKLNFRWPSVVAREHAFVGIMKGAFPEGLHMDGGMSFSCENSASAFSRRTSISKDLTNYFPAPTADTPYAVVVAEYDPSVNADEGTFCQWFISGGIAGEAPKDYKILEFEYQVAPATVDPLDYLNAISGRIHEMSSGRPVVEAYLGAMVNVIGQEIAMMEKLSYQKMRDNMSRVINRHIDSVIDKLESDQLRRFLTPAYADELIGMFEHLKTLI